MSPAPFSSKSFVLLSASLLLATASQAFAETQRFDGIAPSLAAPQHREWAWDGDKSLAIDIPATVHYRSGGPARIVINGPERFLSHVRVGGGRITTDGQSPGFGNKVLDVTVSGVEIDSFALAGGGDLKLGHLSQNTLDLKLSGSGTASADGRVDNVHVVVSGSGDVQLGALQAKTADVTMSGSGDVTVAPSDNLHAAIAGSGTVHAQSRPAALETHVAGSGHVLIADKSGHYAEVAPDSVPAQQRS